MRSAQQAHRANDLPERFGRERVELHEEVDDEGEVVDDNGPLQPRQMDLFLLCATKARAGETAQHAHGWGIVWGHQSSKQQASNSKR